jgi:hypothetical protein
MSAIEPYKMGAGKTKNEGQYDALRSPDGFESSTEVDDWDAERDMRPRLQRRRSIWMKLKGYRWLLDTALLLVIVGLLVDKRQTHHESHQYEVVGDITGFAPTCRFSVRDSVNTLTRISLAADCDLPA